MIAERIRQARLMAGLTLAELGQRVGVTHTTIQKYEKGKLAPSSMQLFRLAQACGLRIDYFLRSSAVSLADEVFQCRRTFGAKSREALRLRVLSIVEKWVELMNCYPERPVRALELPSGWPAVVKTLDEVETLAEAVRREWTLGLATIDNVAQLLETHGILVAALDLDRPDFLGWCGKAAAEDGVVFPVVAVVKAWPRSRQRLALARELGRLCLSGRLEGLDKEAACDRFAGAFLMPREVVRRALGTGRRGVDDRELRTLQMVHGLPAEAILRRAEVCGVMAEMGEPRETGQSQGARRLEVCETENWLERSHLFELLTCRAVSEQCISESKAAELMGVSLEKWRQGA